MAPRVELRRLEDEDRTRILAWRNSPDVRAYMYTDHVIAPEEHAAWFAGLDFGARLLAPVFRQRRAWRAMDVFVAVVMTVTAARVLAVA